MEAITHLRRLFAYDDWANREALQSIRAPTPPRARKVMAHVLAAERLWWNRLNGEAQAFPVWPEWTLAECGAQIADLPPRWREYLDRLTPAGPSTPVGYVNTKGESWTSRAEDILLHVVLHSTYHRGQIATDLRAAGREPATTDFVHALRQGLVR